MEKQKLDKKRFILSFIPTAIFVGLLWLIHVTSVVLDLDLTFLGLHPLKAKGLIGILTAPLIHGDFSHLAANSIPLIILGGLLFYFYRDIAWKVFFLSYFLSNFWIWFGARQAWHIGASGLVYAFAAFLFVSGIVRRDVRLSAISLLVSFLYGSMVWGIFPLVPRVSWESHLMGAIAGVVLALYYKGEGPQRKKYSWEYEDDEEEEFPYWEIYDDDEFN